MAEEQQAGRLAIEPREIWTGGERLSDAQRAQLAGVFGCRVRDGYGASEFLSIAWDCGHGALHVNSDWILVEPVDEAYDSITEVLRAVCAGELSLDDLTPAGVGRYFEGNGHANGNG